MDIAIVNDSGQPEVIIRAADLMNYWFWDMEKADKFSAYLDLVFRSDETGTLITTTKILASRWKVSRDKARRILRLLKNHRYIDYEKSDHGSVKISILIPEV